MIKRTIISILLLSGLSLAHAQIELIVTGLPKNTPKNASIYVSGDFNSWNPTDTKYCFKKKEDGTYTLSLKRTKDLMNFKFTRGSWETVECDQNGIDIKNRILQGNNNTTIMLKIAGWKDLFSPQTAHNTQAENVYILSDSFYMPQLKRYRTIRIMLPKSYAKNPNKAYPVLYMHDGQNLFDNATAFAGEWGIDEILNRLEDQGHPPIIVVAIDNGGNERANEYIPYYNAKRKYGGQADAYCRFMVETLKPHIDSVYRTLPNATNTAIAGSSFGGIVSFYAMLKYPDVFGKAAVFSPSFWVNKNELLKFVAETKLPANNRIYMVTGQLEGRTMVRTMEKETEQLLKFGFPKANLKTKIVPQGRHNEALWNSQFEEVYKWLFEL